MEIGTRYLQRARQTQAMIDDAREHLGGVDFDTMVGTGLSGALVIPVLAHALGKHWLIVRKDNDGSHSSVPVEGALGERWVFVDDFIATGATARRVRSKVLQLGPGGDYEGTYWLPEGQESHYVGDYLYGDGEYHQTAPVFRPYEPPVDTSERDGAELAEGAVRIPVPNSPAFAGLEVYEVPA